MSIKENIENNLIIWFLTSLLGGFLAGIATYKAIIEIAHLEVVPQGQCTIADVRKKEEIDVPMKSYTIEAFSPQILDSENITVSYLGDKYSYDSINKSVSLFINYPQNKNIKITEKNYASIAFESKNIWLTQGKDTHFYLGELGEFKATLKDLFFDQDGHISRLVIEIAVLKDNVKQ
ncbi:hypothetical protein [Pantoea sp. SOD02]|uniref:hypothetical protein n=1 Tax=Pantoea sp. SOD02 TaxID=2970818 RepID=UPI002158456E|nr:hypothetical protein [Pantoea sp. SOD02]UVC31687.1 hypothetical protein NR302_23115 [Pantoea sp. SOD02]